MEFHKGFWRLVGAIMSCASSIPKTLRTIENVRLPAAPAAIAR